MNDDCSEILMGRLWVGSFLRPEDADWLKQMGFTTVISLQCDQDFAEYGISFKELFKAFSETGIELRRTPIRDFSRQHLAENLSKCVAEIETALIPQSARVYLHCTAGINRAPTAAAAYLMRSLGISAREAHNYVTERRCCNPYLDVLEEYASSLKREE